MFKLYLSLDIMRATRVIYLYLIEFSTQGVSS